jgi:hypothetical protein
LFFKVLPSCFLFEDLFGLTTLIMKLTQTFLVLVACTSLRAVIAAPVGGELLAGRDAEPEPEPGFGNYGTYGHYRRSAERKPKKSKTPRSAEPEAKKAKKRPVAE